MCPRNVTSNSTKFKWKKQLSLYEIGHKFKSWILAKPVLYILFTAMETDTDFAGCTIGIMGLFFTIFVTSQPNGKMSVS